MTIGHGFEAISMRSARARPKLSRYHSLDWLCAVTMMLGLVLHTAVNYFQFPVHEAEQIYLDPQSSPSSTIWSSSSTASGCRSSS